MGESQTSARRRRSIVAGAVAALAVTGLVTAAVPAQAVESAQYQQHASASHYAMPVGVTQLVASKDGSVIYAATDSREILEIDPVTKTVKRTITLPTTVTHLTLTSSGLLDAIKVDTGATPALYEVDPATGALVRTTVLPVDFHASGIALTPDGSTGVVTETNVAPQTDAFSLGAVIIHPITGAVGTPISVNGIFNTEDIGITPDGSRAFVLARVTLDGSNDHAALESIDTATAAAAPLLPLEGEVPTDLVMSPDGSRVFVANDTDGDLRSRIDVIDATTDSVVETISSSHIEDDLSSLESTSDGSRIVAAGPNETLSIDPTTLATRDIGRGAERRDSVVVPGTSRIVVGYSSSGVDEIDAATGATVRSARFPDFTPARAVVLPGDHDLYYAATSAAGTPELAHFDLAAGSNQISMDRYDGSDQYSTDVDVMSDAQSYTGSGGQFGYIVSGESAAEDLSVAAAAAHQRAEVVLTAPGALPAAIRKFEEYRTLKALFIIGPNSSVSPYVRSQLVYLTRHHTVIVRITGGDHYATSRAVVRQAFGTRLKHVWITTGNGSSDAMAASSAASYKGEPVLAVNGSASSLDANTATFLRQEKATSFTIVGSTSAVSPGVAASLAKIAPVTRIAGSDPVETSQLVNASVFPKTQNQALFASANSWQDQLLANQLAVVKRAPVDIVPQNCVPDAVAEHLGSQEYARADLIGSTSLLSAEVAADATC
jgi:putative cell wall-binding protein